MRRKEKEIVGISGIEAVIADALVCRIALCDGNAPYIVPVCFGYEDRTVYFHCAPEGKKIDIIARNPRVCFEFEADVAIVKHEQACRWGMRYRSVIGSGRAQIIGKPREKKAALSIIMKHYSDAAPEFSEEALEGNIVVQIAVESITGKRSGV
jgi:nitroimidazol reductase NimA-like FMN-containing flavoprotein (pyridoxamine 5'-phosphate oxidase superfamily)